MVLWILRSSLSFHVRGFHPLWRVFPDPSVRSDRDTVQSEPRGARTTVWALPVPLAATPGIILYFLLLRLLRCFSSPGSPPVPMDSVQDIRVFPGWVSPFRNPRITACLRLPVAYRSLSRLSSAPVAKASTLRSCCLTICMFPCLHTLAWMLLTVCCCFSITALTAMASDVFFLSVCFISSTDFDT